MKIVTLKRFAYSEYGTFGILSTGLHKYYTVERPWLGNKFNVSCIPCGAYLMKLDIYYGGDKPDYPAYMLTVPDRSLIKIHVANTMFDVEGCIGVGSLLGCLWRAEVGRSIWAVLDSKKAFGLFMEDMSNVDEAIINIFNEVKGGVL